MPRKKHSRIEKPIPLEMLERMKRTYPKMFQLYNTIYRLTGNVMPETCIHIVGTVLGDKYKTSINALTLYTLGAWSQYKQIYSVDSDLAEFLTETIDDDMKIPAEIFKNLPYNSFYVECNNTNIESFFVTYNSEINKITFFSVDTESGSEPYTVAISLPLLEGKSIVESINERLINGNPEYDMTKHNDNIKFVKSAVQIILYIASINADVEENPKQKSIYKHKSEKSIQSKDRLSDVRKWDVGFRVGSTLRLHKHSAANTENKMNNSSKPSSKSPHIRRGHFHHFWTGKHDSEERKLVVKWVAPTFINMTGEESIAVVHSVN